MSRRAAFRRVARDCARTASGQLLPALYPGQSFAALPGVADPEGVDELRKRAGFELVSMMGAARTGPVSWLTYSNAVGRVLAAERGWGECVEQLEAWPDAVLIVAVAPGWAPMSDGQEAES